MLMAIILVSLKSLIPLRWSYISKQLRRLVTNLGMFNTGRGGEGGQKGQSDVCGDQIQSFSRVERIQRTKRTGLKNIRFGRRCEDRGVCPDGWVDLHAGYGRDGHRAGGVGVERDSAMRPESRASESELIASSFTKPLSTSSVNVCSGSGARHEDK